MVPRGLKMQRLRRKELHVLKGHQSSNLYCLPISTADAPITADVVLPRRTPGAEPEGDVRLVHVGPSSRCRSEGEGGRGDENCQEGFRQRTEKRI